MNDELARLTRSYAALMACHGEIVRATSEQEMLEAVCRTLVDAGGYRLAWVGLAERDEARSVRPVARAGAGAGYVDGIRTTWGDDDLGKGPVGTAIRARRPSINRSTRTNPDFAPWREVALERGFESSIALPLMVGDDVLGALSVYAEQPDAFDTDECALLVRFAEDLAFGMSSLRTKNSLRDATRARARFAILDEAPSAFMAIDREWRYLYVNAAGARQVGRAPESLLGRVVWEIFPEAVGGPFWRACHRAMDARELVELEDHDEAPDQWFDVRVYPIEVGIGVYFSEVSARKRLEVALRESEERFRQLAENIQEVYWLTDAATGEIVYVSPGYEAVWGRSCQSLYEAPATWLASVHPDDRARIEAAIARSLRGGEYDELYRITRPDGGVRWIQSRRYPVRDGGGRIFRIAGVAQDVTDHRDLEEQFRQAQKMEAVGRLAGGVAHDFNNLLSVILSYSRLIAEKLPPGDPLREDIQQVETAGTRAAELTAQLLAFSRRQVLRPRIVGLDDSIERIHKLLRRVLGEDIELVVRHGEDLWPVEADPGQIDQVVMNLAVNARDAMPRGGRLTIETANVEIDEARARLEPGLTPGPHVALVVRDDGVGMDEATLSRIFEPFFTTKGVGKGTGLGLSTVFGIVRQSGGAIRADSEPGRGTTFTIWLPRAEARAAEAGAPASSAPSRGGVETLLVVEDDAQVRALAAGILRDNGYDVLLASSAGEALRLAVEHPARIHALVTDVVMPEMSGRELAERLARRLPGLKVVYMSGYADEIVGHHGVFDDGVQFLQKPITPGKLVALVRRALDGG